jgi:tRNA-dihydrouridine synthase
MRAWMPAAGRPATVLAPMQDVTHHGFLAILARRSQPDWFVTEYFRVYPNSRVDRRIARCFEENPTGRPVVAQMIGRDPADLVRIARELEKRGAAGVDLNLGCPAPVVCRKEAGGGLLRDPARIDRILEALRGELAGPLTVKTRLGYDAPEEFQRLLEVFARHAIDGLAVHARTVRDGYATPVRPQWVKLAAAALPCPVIANGNAVCAATARALLEQSGAAGIMVGRGAIRNPWIFAQIAADDAPAPPRPHLRDLLVYVGELWEMVAAVPGLGERSQVAAMKKFMNFIADGIDPEGAFLHGVRRAATAAGFLGLCRDFLDRDGPVPERPPPQSGSFRGFGALLGGGRD